MDLERLIRRCSRNDRKAQHELYTSYKDNLYTIAYRIAGDFESASDILQESFIDIFKSIGTIKNPQFFYSWAKKIVVRKAIKHAKKKVVTEDIKEDVSVIDSSSSSLDTEYIEQAIQALSVKSRTVFVMFEIEGFSHKEISETMSISVGTSKSQLNYAKTKLKEILSPYLI